MRSLTRPHPPVLLAVAAALTALAGPARGDEVQLRWQFRPGEVQPFQLEQRMAMRASGPQEVSIEQKVTLDMSWRVRSVTPEGLAAVGLRFVRARVEMRVPTVGVITYDSDERKSAEDPALAQWAALVGEELSYRMNPRGEVTSFEVPAALRAKLRTASGGNTMSEENLRRTAQAFAPFPERSVAAGTRWQTGARVPIAPGLALRLDIGSTYRGPVRVSGREIQKIDYDTTLRLVREEGENPLTFRLLEQKASGGFLFDNVAGKPLSLSTQQRMVMEVRAPDGVIEQTITSRVRCHFGEAARQLSPKPGDAPGSGGAPRPESPRGGRTPPR